LQQLDKKKAYSGETEKSLVNNGKTSSSSEILKHINQKKTTAKDNRSRYWTFIIYPESVPENWKSKLDGLIWIESPLHDKDKNPDGTEKKSHWHILIINQGKISFNQAKAISNLVNGVTPQVVLNIVGMVRYFAHLDNPEKVQYDKNSIIGHGVEVEKYLITNTDYEQIMCEIEDYIDDEKITEYSALVRISRKLKDEHSEWHKCISTHTIHFSKYVSSCRYVTKPKKADISSIIKQL